MSAPQHRVLVLYTGTSGRRPIRRLEISVGADGPDEAEDLARARTLRATNHQADVLRTVWLYEEPRR